MRKSFSKTAENRLMKVIEAFEKGEVAEKCAMSTFPPLKVPSMNWTLHNRWLLMLQGMDFDCRGFRQWQEAGRKVKKGEKAGFILIPLIKKDKDEETETCVGFRTQAVFDASQTKGEPLNYETHPIPELPLLEVAEAWGIEVKTFGFSGFYGMWQDEKKTITLCSPEQRTFFHELVHAAHCRAGFKRDKEQHGQIPLREIVAELGAEVLRQLYGEASSKDTSGISLEYVKHYAEEAKLELLNACLKVLSETAKAIGLIIESANRLSEYPA